MNMGKAIRARAEEVLKLLEAVPAAKRGPMHQYAIDAAKQAKRLALHNQMAATVQLEDAQCELLMLKD